MTHLSYSDIHNHDKVSRGSKEGMASLNISFDMKMGLLNFFLFFFLLLLLGGNQCGVMDSWRTVHMEAMLLQ